MRHRPGSIGCELDGVHRVNSDVSDGVSRHRILFLYNIEKPSAIVHSAI